MWALTNMNTLLSVPPNGEISPFGVPLEKPMKPTPLLLGMRLVTSEHGPPCPSWFITFGKTGSGQSRSWENNAKGLTRHSFCS
jgi:hypothetical protein